MQRRHLGVRGVEERLRTGTTEIQDQGKIKEKRRKGILKIGQGSLKWKHREREEKGERQGKERERTGKQG